MNIQISTGDITDFEGDAIIVPCDSELSYTKSFSPNPKYPLFKHESKKSLVKQIFEKGGKELVREVTTIGFCEIGYAVSIQGYDLKAKRLIFMPVADHNNEEAVINYIALHQSLRAAFTLADIYKIKTLAMPMLNPGIKKRPIWDKVVSKFTGDNQLQPLTDDEVLSIIMSVAKDFEKSSLKEISVYKFVR